MESAAKSRFEPSLPNAAPQHFARAEILTVADGPNRTFRMVAANGSSEPTLPLFDSAAKVCYRGERRR